MCAQCAHNVRTVRTGRAHSVRTADVRTPENVVNVSSALQCAHVRVLGLDLRDDVFSHGQLHVAMGRAHTQDAVTVLTTSDRIYAGRPHSKNIVFPELLPPHVMPGKWTVENARQQVASPVEPVEIDIIQ